MFIVRVLGAMLVFACLGFAVGYFGPIYLLPDPGVGPLTGFFSAPVGAVIGGAAAVHASVRGFSHAKYLLRLSAVAAVYAAVALFVILTQ